MRNGQHVGPPIQRSPASRLHSAKHCVAPMLFQRVRLLGGRARRAPSTCSSAKQSPRTFSPPHPVSLRSGRAAFAACVKARPACAHTGVLPSLCDDHRLFATERASTAPPLPVVPPYLVSHPFLSALVFSSPTVDTCVYVGREAGLPLLRQHRFHSSVGQSVRLLTSRSKV